LDQGNVDDLRERAFSGLASYDQPEPRSAGKEVLLTIVLLAALGGAGWWTYKNYIAVTGTQKPTPDAAATGDQAANVPPNNPTPTNSTPSKESDKPGDKSAAPAEPTNSEKSAEKSSASTESKPATAGAEARQATSKATDDSETETLSKPATPAPTRARHEVSAENAPAAKPAIADSGDGLFRLGETSLYGRNGKEDCGSALKYLKMASDKQNAKARSTMGTMYATGHCVPRDLPSSYRWFALALRADPNNSILEKDLMAVWNQMTPPERQLATKSQ
jgi:localization factor PodJL